MGAPGSKATRRFAIACGVWFVASFVVPSLPFPDVSLVTLLLLLSGSIWIVAVVWAAVPIAAIVLALKRLFAGRYRSAAMWLAIPIAGALLCLSDRAIGDAIRFQLIDRDSYDSVVREAAAGKCSHEDRKRWGVAVDAIDCREPITIVFPWGGFLSNWHGVVYDAGDQIIKPPRERSKAWKSREIGALLSCSGADLDFAGHYYRAGGSYASGTDDCG